MTDAKRPGDWIDQELGLSEAPREIAVLLRRSRHRKLLTLTVALLAAALVVGLRARTPRLFESRVAMAATETWYDASRHPPTANVLYHRIYEIILSTRALLPVMEEYDLYANFRSIDPPFAASQMREDISMDVLRDAFGHAGQQRKRPRSTTFVLSYQHQDPEVAWNVARTVSEMILESSRESRVETTENTLAFITGAAAHMREKLARAQFETAQLRHSLKQADPERRAAVVIQLRRAEGSQKAIEDGIDHIEQTRSRVSIDATSNLAAGLSFELLEAASPPAIPALSRRAELILFGVLSFLLSLPIAAILVGAFDTRVRDLDGLERLGLRPFARTAGFPGYDVTSLTTRRTESSRI